MGNHFHLLIKVKPENEIGFYKSLNSDRSDDSARFKTTTDLSEFKEPDKVRKPNISRHFAHLFNAYSKYYNKIYKRSGALFERPFKRIPIESENHLKYLVYYIHHNPIHHGFCDNMLEYPWTSYLTILSPKHTHLKRSEVLEWYSNPENFQYYHSQQTIDQFHQLHIDMPVLQGSTR
jgi:hypothetical protein